VKKTGLREKVSLITYDNILDESVCPGNMLFLHPIL